MKPDSHEIDEGTNCIGYREALDIVNANVRPMEKEELLLHLCVNRVAAADLAARVSYPSVDVSLKDGFAVKSIDVAQANRLLPVCLKLTGSAFAGARYDGLVQNGEAVKVFSGAPIPEGADAVVSGEFCKEGSSGEVLVQADAGVGRNLMRAGSEVEAQTTIVGRGERLLPGSLGLAAAAGVSRVNVYRRSRVAIISIGD